MISCPNCNHHNPDGAVQCEACYTPLSTTQFCPQCSAPAQGGAAFCGQCGFNFRTMNTANTASLETEMATPATEVAQKFELESAAAPETEAFGLPQFELESAAAPETEAFISPPPTVERSSISQSTPVAAPTPPTTGPSTNTSNATQLQLPTASLLHVQTNTSIEIPDDLEVIHIGKPNEVIPPDIDVSGFPNSEIVSRVHADLRVEAGFFFIVDTGSSNGTYINHVPLQNGNRHKLRAGDRISLGKGDKVTFLFRIS